MESGAAGCDVTKLVELLAVGEEQSRQLEASIEHCSSDLCRALIQDIHSTFKKAISMAKVREPENRGTPSCPNTPDSDSPLSGNGSPRSEISERAFKEHERREITKKRKTLPKWSNQVRVSPRAGAETPLDDGYSWRKYGQKDILGAKYPRGYYRCTHRNAQGCLATKQVQRSDSDPSVFDVIYRGEHTCFHMPKAEAGTAIGGAQENGMQQSQQHSNGQHRDPQELLLSFRTNLKVKTEKLDSGASSSSFSFPSTPIDHVPLTSYNQFTSTFSSPFVSPVTPDSTYSSPFNLHAAEVDLAGMMTAVTSATNTPMVDVDFDMFDVNNFFP